MGFNWEGDRILQDTAIEKKRYIIGEKKSITTDIREWISFEDKLCRKIDIMLDAKPAMMPRDVATLIADKYIKFYKASDDDTQSV